MVSRPTSHQQVSAAALSSLRHTVGETPVQLQASDDNWTTLALGDVLNFLIKESPHFEAVIEELLRSAGAPVCTVPFMVYGVACGDNRLL